jgi:hypothetical protein
MYSEAKGVVLVNRIVAKVWFFRDFIKEGDEGRAEGHLSPKKLTQSSLTSSYTSSATKSSFHGTLARQRNLAVGLGLGMARWVLRYQSYRFTRVLLLVCSAFP